MADAMRGIYCWNGVEITFMNSWTFMNYREPWVVACKSNCKILVVYLSVTVTLQQYTMIEHLIATQKSNCSLKRLFIEICHFACTFVIRKKLGFCDVKHLTKFKAPPWQNTQLPFGALGCDSGDIAGSKFCSTWLMVSYGSFQTRCIWRWLQETASWYPWQNLFPMPRPPPKSTPVQIPDWVHVLSTWDGLSVELYKLYTRLYREFHCALCFLILVSKACMRF